MAQVDDYYCDFEVTPVRPGLWRHRCRRCELVEHWPVERFLRECPKRTADTPRPRTKRPPCKLLGGKVRAVECDGCGGRKTLLFIYACNGPHGECQMGVRASGVKTCGPSCGEYSPG